MFPRNLRLNLKTDFKRVAAGKRIEGKYLKLFILQSNSNPKIGIAVSSKDFKMAHQRNRIKRVISAAFEKLQSKLPMADIIVLPKPGILEVKSNDIIEDLNVILRRLAV